MRLTPSHHLRELVVSLAKERPDGVALCAPGRPDLTFAALAHQVRTTGERLRELGVGPADAVALALPSGPALATTFLAVAGHARCVPLNPAHAAEEFADYLHRTAARAVVVPAGAAGTAATAAARELGVRTLELVTRPGEPAGVGALVGQALDRPAADRPGHPDDVALLLFTSGTIARPRMVPLTHTNLLTAARNTAGALRLAPNDRCLNVMPLFHAHGLTSTLLASLVRGASVVCPPGFDAAAFFDQLDEFSPTWYTAVPAMHRAVLDAAASTGRRPAAGLRFVRSASAPLPDIVLDQLEGLFAAPLVEGYGMTEAASLVTCNPLPPGERRRGSVGLPVGEPVRVLDPAGRPVPVGTPGEIAIRGANVTAGYADDPEANAAAFAHGWLRTGDYGHLDEDGYLYVVGRVKEIINRGGSKVSPAEVDQALAGHPDLAEAAAFALPHPTLGEDVAVAVVPRAGASVREQEVREFAARRLIAHKVPGRVFVVASLPRNAVGKVQRLRLTERHTPVGRGPAVVTGTDLERRIAAIWAAVLGTDRPGATENFFDLGGDSLRLAQVAERLRVELGREVPVPVLLMHPTVRGLATHLSGDGGADPPPVAEQRRRHDGRDRLLRQRRGHGAAAPAGEAG
ncbi:non-ribosomal peptide synthetase [Micromonospora echinofusca]|uniref:non-ribosomal peptide synthetase n=1 Tax=Micromonospora echinofusca TaxID=47858 RepID=UPI000CB5137E|nr:non-ribosomal peptide synthetase [Micromonospora sp. MSM11]MCL7456334.1 non-ribosomal peptide synthetase [Micromonospora sp. MSM11]